MVASSLPEATMAKTGCVATHVTGPRWPVSIRDGGARGRFRELHNDTTNPRGMEKSIRSNSSFASRPSLFKTIHARSEPGCWPKAFFFWYTVSRRLPGVVITMPLLFIPTCVYDMMKLSSLVPSHNPACPTYPSVGFAAPPPVLTPPPDALSSASMLPTFSSSSITFFCRRTTEVLWDTKHGATNQVQCSTLPIWCG